MPVLTFGDVLQVILTNGRDIIGIFHRMTADALILREHGQTCPIALQTISQVIRLLT